MNYVPHVEKLEKDVRYKCEVCGKHGMKKGEMAVAYLGDIWRHYVKVRRVHFDCWVRKNVVLAVPASKMRTLRREAFLEVV